MILTECLTTILILFRKSAKLRIRSSFVECSLLSFKPSWIFILEQREITNRDECFIFFLLPPSCIHKIQNYISSCIDLYKGFRAKLFSNGGNALEATKVALFARITSNYTLTVFQKCVPYGPVKQASGHRARGNGHRQTISTSINTIWYRYMTSFLKKADWLVIEIWFGQKLARPQFNYSCKSHELLRDSNTYK